MTVHATRPPGSAPDWTIPQDWASYTAPEHAMWDNLFARQSTQLPGRAVPEHIRGLDVLRMDQPGIPDFEQLSARLMALTGWQVVAVPGLVPDAVFFDHLANRRFVAGRFIRAADQIDYLQEPDVFHDLFGHAPLLADPLFADYLQAYGQGAARAQSLGGLENLARLYWYTVEFGLIKTAEGLRVYGAGIVSSNAETLFALESPSPNRLGFNMCRVMQTEYRIDDYQQSYFVIDSFADLLAQTQQTDFAPLYAALANAPPLAVDAVLASDTVFTRGTQAHVPPQPVLR